MVFVDPLYFLQLPKKELKRWRVKTIVEGVNDEWDQFSSFQEYDAFIGRLLTETKIPEIPEPFLRRWRCCLSCRNLTGTRIRGHLPGTPRDGPSGLEKPCVQRGRGERRHSPNPFPDPQGLLTGDRPGTRAPGASEETGTRNFPACRLANASPAERPRRTSRIRTGAGRNLTLPRPQPPHPAPKCKPQSRRPNPCPRMCWWTGSAASQRTRSQEVRWARGRAPHLKSRPPRHLTGPL